jgi:hypothetical protein
MVENTMDPQVTNALRESNWRSLCNTAEIHARKTGHSCLPEFRELIDGVTSRFVQLPTPKTDDEFNARMTEKNCVSAVVTKILEGSKASEFAPQARQQIYALAKALTEMPLGTPFSDVLSACTAFSIRMNSLRSGS